MTCLRKPTNIAIGASLLLSMALAFPAIAAGQPAATVQLSLPSQPLSRALTQIGRSADIEIIYDAAVVRGKLAPAIIGHFSAEQALDRALAGTGLQVRRTGEGAYVVERLAAGKSSGEDPAGAPAAQSEAAEIVVTARRKDEASQDVPLVVNAVTPETLSKLNIRRFEDVATIVPGLTLTPNSLSPSASLRGVNFDVFASGSNATVEFYMNDAPIVSNFLIQSMFDVGQIEVLRGPQGTLRGRASPSGAITFTTRRPDLQDFGASASLTGTSLGGFNAQGSINIPIVKDVLSIRVAAMYDENEDNRVRSINNTLGTPDKPRDWTRAGRVSVQFEPTDTITIDASYQHMIRRTANYGQVESVNIIDPTAAASPTTIQASDRLSVYDFASTARQKLDTFHWAAEWRVAGQRLNYVGSHSRFQNDTVATSDPGDFFDRSFTQTAAQFFPGTLHAVSNQESHEVRLSSEEPLFGIVDYVVGAFSNKNAPPSHLEVRTPFFLGVAATPATNASVLLTPIDRLAHSKEQSAFGNLTLHIGEGTEASGGLRYIDYKVNATLAINNVLNPAATQNDHFTATIYAASLKHRFNDNLMVYASIGSSWRPGIYASGNFSLAKSPLELSFIILPPETSTSYEAGLKSTWLDRRLRFNATYFHQNFKNYPYRSASGVNFVSTDFNSSLNANVESVKNFTFVAPVPVKVNGVEVEAAFQATPHWYMGANFSYALGKISNARVPCNDYAPRDGIPDTGGTIPSVATIRTATGGDNLSTCSVSLRANLAPLWTAALQSEYDVPVSATVEAYLRGLLTLYGDSRNDPANAVDDVKSYARLNLFLGIRDPKGAWEVSLYGKNITDSERVLTRGSRPLTVSYATLTGGKTGVSSYRGITLTQPREFGVNVRFAFGSR